MQKTTHEKILLVNIGEGLDTPLFAMPFRRCRWWD